MPFPQAMTEAVGWKTLGDFGHSGDPTAMEAGSVPVSEPECGRDMWLPQGLPEDDEEKGYFRQPENAHHPGTESCAVHPTSRTPVIPMLVREVSAFGDGDNPFYTSSPVSGIISPRMPAH